MAGFRFTIPQYIFDGSTYPAADITVIPDKGFSARTAPRVLKAQFGDGYQQRLGDGINTLAPSFSISFAKRPQDEIDDIVAYFEILGAVTPFNLTISNHREGISSPNETTVRVLCNSWNQVWLYDDFYSLTAELERYYGPV